MFHSHFIRMMNLKQDNPGMGLCMLVHTEHCDLLPKYSYSYKWLNNQINRVVCSNLSQDDAKSEQDYRDQALNIINGKKWSWALVMPVDEATNITQFCKIFLFAHNVLKHTLPIVCMSPNYYGVFRQKANPETITRLEDGYIGNCYLANETDTLMLKSKWRTDNGHR